MLDIKLVEIRPGRWVKVIDGRFAGPASEAEVTAWKRGEGQPQDLWQDVVRQSRIGRPSPEPAPQPQRAALAKEQAPRESQGEGVSFWQDVLSQNSRKKAARQELPPQEAIPEREAAPPLAPDEAEQAAGDRTLEADPAQQEALPPVTKSAAAPTSTTPDDLHDPDLLASALANAGQDEVEKTDPVEISQERATTQESSEKDPLDEVEDASGPSAPLQAPDETDGSVTVAKEDGKLETGKAWEGSTPSNRPHKRTVSRQAVPAPTGTPADARRDQGEETEYVWIAVPPGDSMTDAISQWIVEYGKRFGRPPVTVICNALDLPELEEAQLPVQVRAGKGIPVHHFWIGLK